MANDAVGLTQQFRLAIAGDPAERLIGVSDTTLEAGLGDDNVVLLEEDFRVGRLDDRSHGTTTVDFAGAAGARDTRGRSAATLQRCNAPAISSGFSKWYCKTFNPSQIESLI